MLVGPNSVSSISCKPPVCCSEVSYSKQNSAKNVNTRIWKPPVVLLRLSLALHCASQPLCCSPLLLPSPGVARLVWFCFLFFFRLVQQISGSALLSICWPIWPSPLSLTDRGLSQTPPRPPAGPGTKSRSRWGHVALSRVLLTDP